LTRHLDRLALDGLVYRGAAPSIAGCGRPAHRRRGHPADRRGEMLDRFGDELEALLSEEEPAVLITCLNRITDRCAKELSGGGSGTQRAGRPAAQAPGDTARRSGTGATPGTIRPVTRPSWATSQQISSPGTSHG
jgi:hypothetical protein